MRAAAAAAARHLRAHRRVGAPGQLPSLRYVDVLPKHGKVYWHKASDPPRGPPTLPPNHTTNTTRDAGVQKIACRVG